MNSNSFPVAVIGIPQREQLLLRSVFKLASKSKHSYVLVPLDAHPSPQLLFVDGDDAHAVKTWRELRVRDKHYLTMPAVMVGQAEIHSEGKLYRLQRPLLASRVLHSLNQIANETVTLATYKALVVDDSPSMRKQVEIELKPFDVQADLAESAEQAFRLLSNGMDYDIIFLDVILPGVDGYKVCKAIKKDKRHKKTPVIMLTSKGSPFDRIRGKLAGCDTYLTKPVGPKAFQAIVEKCLSRQNPHGLKQSNFRPAEQQGKSQPPTTEELSHGYQ